MRRCRSRRRTIPPEPSASEEGSHLRTGFEWLAGVLLVSPNRERRRVPARANELPEEQ
jgi:hypothetical protein